MPETETETPRIRGFWSGSISFGLVSVPVSLFAATRSGRPSLRMVDSDGTPLSRRFFCSSEQQVLDGDEIVRGYEVEKDRYVVVDDDELEAIAPEKSREIDLQKFVPLSDIDPAYFERAYFLAPGKGGVRPYRLLAKAMEDAGRAGVATFVMRGKEYLVAIIAERGMLRAEIMRFEDELRTPADVGLPEKMKKPDKERVRAMRAAMRKLHADRPDDKAMADRYLDRLQKLVRRKLESGEDVYAAPEDAESSEQESAEIIDLMQVLKDRLRETASSGAPANGGRKGAKRGTLENRSRAELYERAKTLDIAGRSNMDKAALIRAIRDAG